MKTNLLTAFVSSCIALFTLLPAHAQSYQIDWYSIDGGGGTSTGGVYTVSGSIGQPDAGTMTGGDYSITGGFWGMASVIQTPGAPLLSITWTNQGFVVSWPTPSTGYVLEQNSILGSPMSWSMTSQARQTNATSIFVTVPMPVGNVFYRLRKQ